MNLASACSSDRLTQGQGAQLREYIGTTDKVRDEIRGRCTHTHTEENAGGENFGNLKSERKFVEKIRSKPNHTLKLENCFTFFETEPSM